jgi:hypothetical protein
MGAGYPSPRLREEARLHLVVQTGSEGEAEAGVRGVDGGASFGEPPHLRLPPRRADDKVVAALSPQAGRGGAHSFSVGHRTTFVGPFTRNKP